MTYGDDRTAGAMGDDERRDYVRQDGAAMAAPPDGPSRDLRERLIRALYVATWDETFEDWADASEIEIAFTGSQVDAILTEITRSCHVIVRERAIGDALSDAIMEATNHGWTDPDSAIWRRGMAAGHRTLGLAYPGESEVGR